MDDELLAILSQIPAAITKALIDVLVIKHPGHANQKTHGHRYSTTGDKLEVGHKRKDVVSGGAKGASTRAKQQEFSRDIDAQVKVNSIRDRQNLLQHQIHTENLKPKYKKEKQVEIERLEGEARQVQLERVRSGSFIKARGTSMTGLVTGKGTIKIGKQEVPVFRIKDPRGNFTVIPVHETDVISL